MLVYEDDGVLEYLESRNILKPYKKVKANFESGRLHQVQLKKRKPADMNEWQFRITQKYRAIGYFKDDGFLVIRISDHQ